MWVWFVDVDLLTFFLVDFTRPLPPPVRPLFSCLANHLKQYVEAAEILATEQLVLAGPRLYETVTVDQGSRVSVRWNSGIRFRYANRLLLSQITSFSTTSISIRVRFRGSTWHWIWTYLYQNCSYPCDSGPWAAVCHLPPSVHSRFRDIEIPRIGSATFSAFEQPLSV